MRQIEILCFLFFQILIACCQPGIKVGNTGTPLIVAHRGGFDTFLPENSIALFDFTFEKACLKPIAIEFDIRESASGSLFLMHDSTLDRTTNGTGKIDCLPDNYIETLFLKDRNGVLTTEKVPLFSQVLRHYQDKNIILMLDVKGKIWNEVINLVSQMHMEPRCILLTFNQENTKLAKELSDKIIISALVADRNEWKLLQELNIPNQQLIAYVSEETSLELIREIFDSNVLLMTDMSESIRNNAIHYEPYYYRNILTKLKLGILISDFPVYVAQLFCN